MAIIEMFAVLFCIIVVVLTALVYNHLESDNMTEKDKEFNSEYDEMMASIKTRMNTLNYIKANRWKINNVVNIRVKNQREREVEDESLDSLPPFVTTLDKNNSDV